MSSLRVLFVEDDKQLRRSLRRTLREEFDVTEVGTLTAARVALEGAEFAILLLDIELPDGDAFELLRELYKNDIRIPTVIYSGSVTPEALHQAAVAGVVDILAKGCALEELLTALRRASAYREASG